MFIVLCCLPWGYKIKMKSLTLTISKLIVHSIISFSFYSVISSINCMFHFFSSAHFCYYPPTWFFVVVVVVVPEVLKISAWLPLVYGTTPCISPVILLLINTWTSHSVEWRKGSAPSLWLSHPYRWQLRYIIYLIACCCCCCCCCCCLCCLTSVVYCLISDVHCV